MGLCATGHCSLEMVILLGTSLSPSIGRNKKYQSLDSKSYKFLLVVILLNLFITPLLTKGLSQKS